MTSKEALHRIENLISNDTYYLVSYEKEFKAINKDLELLEIIKKYCEIELFYEFAFNRYLLSFTEKTKTKDTFDTPISREDAEKIAKYFDYLKMQDSITGKVEELEKWQLKNN